MDQQVSLAVIAAILGALTLVAPIMTARMVRNANRADKAQDAEQAAKVKEADYARQDEVAMRAEHVAEAARLASQRAIEAAETARRGVEETAKLMAANNEETSDKLGELKVASEVIHTLVNSNYTAALQAELDAKRSNLVSLKEIVDLKSAAGSEPSPAALTEITNLEGKITELQDTLAKRLDAVKLVEMQQKAALKGIPAVVDVVAEEAAQARDVIEAAKDTVVAAEKTVDAAVGKAT